MAMDEKTAVDGIANMPATPERPHLLIQKESLDVVSLSQCPTPREEYDPSSTHPFSPFYSHPTTRTSMEQLKNSSTTVLNPYEHDLEAGSKSRVSCEPSNSGAPQKDCTIWPKRQTLLKQRKDLKRSKGCYPWSHMNKKQRLWAKAVIILLFIGICLGIGFGVSKAVGGGIYRNSNTTTPLGSS